MKENEIDSMIREALSKEDAARFESVGGEQSAFTAAMDLFQGRSRWLVFASVVVMIFLMVVAVFAAIKFLDTGRVHLPGQDVGHRQDQIGAGPKLSLLPRREPLEC